VMLTVTNLGVPRNPLILNSTAPLTQKLGCKLQWIALLFSFVYINSWYNCV